MLYFYESHWSHILKENLINLEDWDYQKVVRYVIANTRNLVLVLVDFQDKASIVRVVNSRLYFLFFFFLILVLFSIFIFDLELEFSMMSLF